jgi:DNA-directed RNA polymerase subunit RPC12/RpoP
MKAAFSFPELQERTAQRPSHCPRCGHVGMGRHRISRRPVVDLKVTEVEVVQYRCWRCKASLTVTPPGLGHDRRHSERTKVMSVVLWGLGLSYEDVARVMKGVGTPISDVGALLNVRAMGADALLASAALDRLTHHARVTVITGESYRQRHRRKEVKPAAKTTPEQ